MTEKWLKQYKENYEGKSAEAKSVAEYLKENYKGNKYIPWATMERLTYMQDPNAVFTKIRNEQGGLVHTDSFINENVVEGKDGTRSASKALVVSHFVKVSVVFMGKEFVEEYPIQEQDYSAAKIYNQNLVNKSLQRALAKVASRATGIGLKLYENKDLQFEEDNEEEKKPVVKKTTKKVELTDEQKAQNIVDGGETAAYLNGERTFEPQEVSIVEDKPKAVGEVIEVDGRPALGIAYTASQTEEETAQLAYPKEIKDLCTLIRNADKEKMTRVLQSVNVPILKQHKFTLNLEDSDAELCEKISHFPNIPTFTNAIKNMLGE